MIKFRMFSGVTNTEVGLGRKILQNAKRQAIENPLTTGSLGLVAANSSLNLYNTLSNKAARKKQAEKLEELEHKGKRKVILI